MQGHTSEGFLLNLMWEDPLLIGAMPPFGSLSKDMEGGSVGPLQPHPFTGILA